MTIKLLTVPIWDGNKSTTRNIEKPMWKEVEQAIRGLNGLNRSDVYLTPDPHEPETFLGVGGGPEHFLVTGSVNGETFPTLMNAGPMNAGEVALTVGGQSAEYPANWIHNISAVLVATKVYWQTGQFAGEGLVWENV